MLEQSRFVLELKAYLTNQWEKFKLPGTPSPLAYRIRQSPLGRAIDRSRFVALWFQDDPEKPVVATKWSIDKKLAPFIVQEHRHAEWLFANRGHRFIPRPLDCTEVFGIPVLIEEAALGRSFAHQLLSLPFGEKDGNAIIEKVYSSMFEKAKDLIAQIQDPLIPVPADEILSYLEPYIMKAETILGLPSETSKSIRKILHEIPNPISGSGQTLLVGDFTPQNILEGKKGIFLIDLEFSLKSPLAFLDPMAFVYTMSRLSIPDFSREEVPKAIQLLIEHLLRKPDAIADMSQQFLAARGLSLPYLRWYWLVFFIHEAAFQQFLSETLSPQLKTFFSTMLDALLK